MSDSSCAALACVSASACTSAGTCTQSTGHTQAHRTQEVGDPYAHGTETRQTKAHTHKHQPTRACFQPLSSQIQVISSSKGLPSSSCTLYSLQRGGRAGRMRIKMPPSHEQSDALTFSSRATPAVASLITTHTQQLPTKEFACCTALLPVTMAALTLWRTPQPPACRSAGQT